MDFLALVEETWKSAFTPDLVRKAFEKCGIYPINREKYPEEDFCQSLLTVYKAGKQHVNIVSS